MAIEYKGEEFIYAVVLPSGLYRPFNQTSGTTTSSADEIELDTKDKTGSDYGKVTQEISFEGIFTQGDEFIKEAKKIQRKKQFVEIYDVDTRTLEAEKGLYMITSFEKSAENGDHVTYSISAKLNGELTDVTLTELPEGAPESEDETE